MSRTLWSGDLASANANRGGVMPSAFWLAYERGRKGMKLSGLFEVRLGS